MIPASDVPLHLITVCQPFNRSLETKATAAPVSCIADQDAGPGASDWGSQTSSAAAQTLDLSKLRSLSEPQFSHW